MDKHYCPYCMTPVVPGEPCPNCGLTGGSYTSQPHQLPAGTILADRYLLGRVLGEGGFGITYIGCDTRLELRVAVKEYYPVNHVSRNCRVSNAVNCFTGVAGQGYEKGRERFIREARTMARMDKTPQIVAVRDYFQENNTAYIVMEYVDGTTFKELVAQKGGKIPAAELLSMVEPLFGALESMHALGLIHRDISPDNLMLENGMVRLLDFGCARESAAKGSETMTIVLKQGYSPVEQYQHKGQGPWTDVYSLAATMYYCLTGVTPPQALDRICDDELVPPRKLGADLTKAQELSLLFGMGLQPTRRFRSVREFYASLYQGVPVPVKPQVLYGPNYAQEEASSEIPPVEEKDERSIPVTAPMEVAPEKASVTTPQVEVTLEAKEQPAQVAPEEETTEAEAPEEPEAEAETPEAGPEETAPAEITPETTDSGEEAPEDVPWHFPPVSEKPASPAAVKKSKKKIWIPVAAACGLVAILAVSIPLMLRLGSPDPTVPGASTGSTVQSTEPAQPEVHILRLNGSCNQAFSEALTDSSVDEIVLESDSWISFMAGAVEINKPVLIEEGAGVNLATNSVTVAPGATLTVQGYLQVRDLTVQGNVEISGMGSLDVLRRADVNGGQVHVKSWMNASGLLAVSGGGQVFVENNGSMYADCYLLEREDSIVAQEDFGGLDFDLPNVAIVNEEALFADAVHVNNYQELKSAADAGAKAIVIDGSVTVSDNFPFGPDAALMISPEGALILESYDTTVGAATLINRGTLAGPVCAQCFINYGKAEASIYPAQLRGDERQLFMNLGNADVHGMLYCGPVYNLGVVRYTAESERYSSVQEPFFCGFFLNGRSARLEVDAGRTFELGDYLGNSGTILVREGGAFNNYGRIEEVSESASIDLSGTLQNDGYMGLTSCNFRMRDGGSVNGSGVFYIHNADGGALTQDNRVTCRTYLEKNRHGEGPDQEATTLEQLRAILDEGSAGCAVIPEGAVIQVPEDLQVNMPIVVRGELHMAPGTTLSLSSASLAVESGLLEVDRLEAHDASQLVVDAGANILFQPGGLLRIESSCGNFMQCGLDLNGASVELEGEATIFLADQTRNCGDHLTLSNHAEAYIDFLQGFSQASQVQVENRSRLDVFGGTSLSSGASLTLRDAHMHNAGYFYMDNSTSLVLEGEDANLYSAMGNLGLDAGSSIEIRDGYLEMWAWGEQTKEIHADIVNDGTFRVATTNLGGHVVNRGEMQIAGTTIVRVSGTLENLGVIYIEDDSSALLNDGGAISGSAPVRR